MTSTLIQLLPMRPNVIDKWYLLWVIRHSHLGLYNSSGHTTCRLGPVHNHWTASGSSLGALAKRRPFVNLVMT